MRQRAGQRAETCPHSQDAELDLLDAFGNALEHLLPGQLSTDRHRLHLHQGYRKRDMSWAGTGSACRCLRARPWPPTFATILVREKRIDSRQAQVMIVGVIRVLLLQLKIPKLARLDSVVWWGTSRAASCWRALQQDDW